MSLGQATKHRWGSGLRAVLSVGVSAALLWLLARSLNLDRLLALFSGSQPGWFVTAALLVPVQVGLGAIRWRRVSVDLGLDLSTRRAVEEYGLSTFLNQILPGGVAGDAVRVWRHRQGHGELGAPLRAAVVDRVIGHWAHLIVTLVGLLSWHILHRSAPPEGSLPLIVVIGLVFGALWYRPVPGMRALVSDTRVALDTTTGMVWHLSVSILLVATLLLSFWLCAKGLGLTLGWAVITAVPLLMLVMVLPVSLGGWGLRELSATVVLSFLGWSSEEAVALSAAYGVVNLIGSTPAFVVLFRSSGSKASA